MRTSDSMWEILHLIGLVISDFFAFEYFQLHIQYSNLLASLGTDFKNHNPFVLIHCFHISTCHVLYLAIVIDLSVSSSTRIFHSWRQEQCLCCCPPYLISLKWCIAQSRCSVPGDGMIEWMNIHLLSVGTWRGKQQDRRARPINRPPKYRSCHIRWVTIYQLFLNFTDQKQTKQNKNIFLPMYQISVS